MFFLYYVHNEYCPPYVYSLFCLSEYAFVLTNMAYHMTAYYDFFASEVVVTQSEVTIRRPVSSEKNGAAFQA